MMTKRAEVPADVARSWLLVNGAHSELFNPARASRADQIILDIEDAVDPSKKPEARESVAAWLEAGNSAWVRINDRNSPFWADDIERLRKIPTLQGLMLAKTESAAHVEDTYFAAGQAKPIIALVESALGIEDARQIACARGVFRLAFGSGDYRRDTGTAADNMAMAYPRSRLVTASRVGNLPGPIDGPTVGASHPILREQSEHSVVLGLTGKLALAIDQCVVINDTICPTNSDVIWAREFMADFEARGRVIRDGSDLPRLGRAQKIDRLATVFGINPQ